MRCFLGVILTCFMVGCSAQRGPTMVGQHVPEVRLEMFGEDPKLLSDFKGKTTHILFWGTWCAASRAALSQMRTMSETSDDNFIAISGDNEDVELGDWLERNGRGRVKYVFSGNQIADEAFVAFNVQDVPVLVVIDPLGKIIYQGDAVVEQKPS